MERKSNLSRPISTTTTAADSNLISTSTSTSVSVSPPDFLRHINAAYKRHRPLGTLQANFPRASRVLVHRKEPSSSEIVDEKLTKTKLGFDPGKDRAVEVRANAAPAPGTVNMCPFGMQKGDADAEAELIGDRNNASLETLSTHLMDVEFPSAVDAGVDFRFKKGEGQYSNQGTINDLDLKLHDVANVDLPGMGGANKIEKREDHKHNSHCIDAMIRSNTMGSSCATTMSIHSGPTFQCTRAPPPGHTGVSTYTSSEVLPNMMKDGDGQRHPQQSLHSGEAIVEKVDPKNASRLQSQVPSTNNPSSGVVMDISQPCKAEKAPRKKKYDPDVFFKVNGKLYQRLGKIGSGGSSEVHKVISSDCTVYALKKIKLKGRDYPTAYGFCQEIEYLNKLKGKSNIIQLIDYEVTDKTLLQEVLNGSMTIKEGRIKDDQYIYMVLEYGEIDLAHMLSHKWKEAESSNWKIDENWLRFYWQQMLEAVNTIHEERIVHSDLKPANFLLVRGSLKLIDFGIAKSILSDTTNIQRDAQVGTLNYMSPEAFMWNEQDDSGNTIKCGRPSDIWSLGCILYQMVYGKTPFADYKTFWAKFKIITDKNHEISYKPLPNPLLIDLMKHCLAWDRNERWRIPQLLQHPFLLPPFPIEMPPNLPNKLHYSFLLEKIGVFWNEPQVSRLCSELYEVICNLEKAQDGNTP